MRSYGAPPSALYLALVALAATAVATSVLFWSAIGGGGQASAGTTASVSLDAVSDGANTATSIGAIDDCRVLTSGETAALDLVIQDVSGLSGFEVNLVYDPAVVRVVTLTALLDVDYEFLLASGLTSIIALGDELPDDGSGTFKLAAAQFPSSPVSGSGVLARFRLEAVGSGSTAIALSGVKLSDGTGAPIQPSDSNNIYQGPVNGAAIAVDVTCGPDADGDGVADSTDNCPFWHNPTQALPPWTVPDGDEDCDGFTSTIELAIGTAPDSACGFTEGGDPASDSWPPDFAESNSIDIVDILALKPVFLTDVPPTSARLDLDASGKINIIDVLQLKPYFGLSCS